MIKTFTSSVIFQTTNRVIQRRYGCYVRVSKDTTFEELSFDKYDMLYVVFACEEFFELTITPEEMAALKTVGELNRLVIDKLKATARFVDAKKEPKGDAPVQVEDEEVPEEEQAEADSDDPYGNMTVEEQQKAFAEEQMAEEAEPAKEKSLAEQQAEYAKEQMAAEEASTN